MSKEAKTNYTQEMMKIIEEICLDIIEYEDGTTGAMLANALMNRTKKLREEMEAEYELNE